MNNLRIVLFLLASFPIASLPTAAAQNTPATLTVDAAVRLFLDRNLEMEAARLAIERTRASQIAAAVRPNPGLTVAAENFSLRGPVPFDDIYEVAVSYSETIELGGKRQRRTELADLSVAVAEAELADTLRKGVAELKRLYYETVLAQENVRIAAENHDGVEQLATYSLSRFEEGAIAEADLIGVRLERMQFEATLKRAELELRQKNIRLIERLGDTDYRNRSLVGEFVFDPIMLDLEALKAMALENRPDLWVARLDVDRAGALFSLEEARGVPDVMPFVGYKRVASSNTLLFGVTVPLRVRDQNQGGIAHAAAERRIAEARLAAVRNRILAEVEAAYAAYESARSQVLRFRDQMLGDADQSQRIALVAYQEGASDLLPLLEAQRTDANVRRSYYATLRDYHASLIDMELAVGMEIRQ